MKGHFVIIVYVVILIGFFAQSIDCAQLCSRKVVRVHMGELAEMNQVVRRSSTKAFVLVAFVVVGQRTS